MLSLGSTAACAQDLKRGEDLYEDRCEGCHSLTPDEHGAAPSLAGIFGNSAGDISGYDSSDVIKDSGIVWDSETLDDFLAEGLEDLPGPHRPGGLSIDKAADRAALAAFIETN
jgi:cytochrome c